MTSTMIVLPETPLGWNPCMGTLAKELHISGRGLHTGRKVHVRIMPSEKPGILFRRLKAGKIIGEAVVSQENWQDHPLCSSLKLGASVFARTVEHVLAALLMCEIDAACVELDGEEVPILDASCLEWTRRINECGRRDLPQAKKFMQIVEEFHFEYGKAKYCFSPGNEYCLHAVTHENDFKLMEWQGVVNSQVFATEIAPARSFGHLRRVFLALLGNIFLRQPILRGVFHAPGAILCCKSVLGGMTVPNELVRHRILDAIGDFAFAGAPILGEISIYKTSHLPNHLCLAALLAAKDKWVWAKAPVTD